MTAAPAKTASGPWDARASCRDHPNLMDVDAKSPRRVQKALGVCARCPVLQPCRAWALTRPAGQEVGGVCGGLTEQQRRDHRDRQITKSCGDCGRAKRLVEFGRNSVALDGRTGVCRDCLAARPAPEPDPDEPAYRTCRTCGQTKLADQFSRDTGSRSRKRDCRACRAAAARQARAAARDARAAVARHQHQEVPVTTSTLNGSAPPPADAIVGRPHE